MKKNIITGFLIIGIAVGSFFIGTTQAQTVEVKTEVIPEGYTDTESYDFYNNYIDMREVADFETDGNGFQITLEDGSGYYWER